MPCIRSLTLLKAHTHMNTFPRRAALALTAAATLTLAACGSGATSTAGSTTTASSSAPATAMAGSSGGTSAAVSSTNLTHNNADVIFAQQMIVHHQGAIDMADLAATRAGSQQVKDLAVKIKAAQTPEIDQMTGWLQTWSGAPGMAGTSMTRSSGQVGTSMMSSSAAVTGMGGMNDGTNGTATSGTQMPGMMTADQTAQLTAATGAAFDRLFLQLMINHHQ